MAYRLSGKPASPARRGNKHLDGDPRAVEMIDKTPAPGLMVLPGRQSLISGRAIERVTLPTRMQMNSGPRAIVDFDGYNDVEFVSSEFKDLVEKLEPDVHQFFTLELVDRHGEYLTDHWIWVVCNRIDGMDRARTTQILWENRMWANPHRLPEDKRPAGYDPATPVTTVFNRSQIGDCHFWRDQFIVFGEIYCSDAAAAAIEGAKLTGINLLPIETV